jgi:O6-methylguanine-DNA--protein-cysteine methyltransferase
MMGRKKEQGQISSRAPARGSDAAEPAPRAASYEQAFEKIYSLVLRIPRGRVMTYGQIARLLEDRYSPRLVGWAMHATPKDDRNIPLAPCHQFARRNLDGPRHHSRAGASTVDA